MNKLFNEMNRLANEVRKERKRLVKEIARRLVDDGVVVSEKMRSNDIYESELFKDLESIYVLEFNITDEGEYIEEDIYSEMVKIIHDKK